MAAGITSQIGADLLTNELRFHTEWKRTKFSPCFNTGMMFQSASVHGALSVFPKNYTLPNWTTRKLMVSKAAGHSGCCVQAESHPYAHRSGFSAHSCRIFREFFWLRVVKRDVGFAFLRQSRAAPALIRKKASGAYSTTRDKNVFAKNKGVATTPAPATYAA